MNLRTIPHLSKAFGVPTGLSDHSMSLAVPVAAVTLGACVIEKHFTLSRNELSPDSSFSLEPSEFKEMVNAVRTAEKAIGEVYYGLTKSEKESRIFRRSLFAVKYIKAGEKIVSSSIRSIRPGHGLHTRHLNEIIGRRAKKDILPGTPLSWDLV